MYKHKIFLSINNNEVVMQFDVLPSALNYSQSQKNEAFETNNGVLNIPGNLELAEISFSSYKSVDEGFDFSTQIATLRERKQPFRIIVTNTDINLPVTIENFTYIYTNLFEFTLNLKEYRFVG